MCSGIPPCWRWGLSGLRFGQRWRLCHSRCNPPACRARSADRGTAARSGKGSSAGVGETAGVVGMHTDTKYLSSSRLGNFPLNHTDDCCRHSRRPSYRHSRSSGRNSRPGTSRRDNGHARTSLATEQGGHLGCPRRQQRRARWRPRARATSVAERRCSQTGWLGQPIQRWSQLCSRPARRRGQGG